MINHLQEIDPYIESAMVKAAHQTRYGGEFPDVCVKLFDYCATLGIVVPSHFRKNRSSILWAKYVDQTVTVDNFVHSACRYVVETAADFVRRMGELCSLFDIVLTQEELDVEALKYQMLVFLGNTIPQLKYSVNLTFSKFLQVDKPEGSFLTHLGLSIFPRRLRVWIQLHCSPRGRRDISVWTLMNTIFMGFKKGLLPCEPHIVEESLRKHRVALTKDPSIRENLTLKIKRMCKQIFSKFRIGRSFPETENQSTHSTSVYTYSDGGNVGFARDVYYNSAGHFNVHSWIGDQDLLGFVTQKGKAVHFPVPVYQRSPLTLSEMEDVYNNTVFKYRDWSQDQLFVDHSGFSKLKPDCCLEAVPACILEPMKVRLITKPGLGLHFRMHKLQKALRSYYRENLSDLFALTGEPLRRDHLWPIIGQGFHLGEGMVSADFSAATDNLKGGVTEAIIKHGFGQKVFLHDPILYENVLNTLRGVDVLQERTVLPKYKNILDSYQYELQNFRQVNGQLMGHVISFLILCVANLCAYWDSWERFLGTKLSLTQLRKRHPCLINGDDLLFKSCHEHYRVWWSVIQEYGLNPSVGKNFYSDQFLQINSELWKIDTALQKDDDFPHLEELLFKRIENLRKISYVNFGLITNRKKQDCTIDAVVSSSQGINNLDSLEGRMAAIPDIRNKLRENLPPSVVGKAEEIFRNHCVPVFEYFGVHSEALHFGNRRFENEFRLCFGANTSPDLRHREALGDLSSSLVREPLMLHKGRINHLIRRCKKSPDWLQGPFGKEEYEPTEKEDWVSVLETPETVRRRRPLTEIELRQRELSSSLNRLSSYLEDGDCRQVKPWKLTGEEEHLLHDMRNYVVEVC